MDWSAAFVLPGTIFLLLCHTYPHRSLLKRPGNGMSYLDWTWYNSQLIVSSRAETLLLEMHFLTALRQFL